MLPLVLAQYKKFNTAGHGGVDTDVFVVNPKKKGQLLRLTCDTLVTLSGQPMNTDAMEWVAIARARLGAIYNAKYCGGSKVGPNHIKTLTVSAAGSPEHQFFIRLRLLSTRCNELNGVNAESQCRCGCKEKSFNKKALTATLTEIKGVWCNQCWETWSATSGRCRGWRFCIYCVAQPACYARAGK